MVNRIPLDSLCQPKVATLPNDFDDVIDYIDISSVDNESKAVIAHQEVDAKDAPSRARQLLQVGDVIVSTVRPNLNAVALVESAYENTLVGSTGYCVLRVKEGVDNRFIFYFCQSPYFVEDMTAQATGASYPAVTSSIVRNSTLPAYTLEEQHEIAQHLDTVTTLISLRKQQIAKLDEMVKARFVEMFGDETQFSRWHCGCVGDVAEVCVGVVIKPTQYYAEHGIPAFRSLNIGELQVKDNDWVYFTEEGHAKNQKSVIRENDVLVVRSGAPGTACVATKKHAGYNAIDIIIAHPDNTKVNSVFLAAFTNMPHGMNQIKEKTGGAAQQHFNVGGYKTLNLILPPMELQNQFAAFVAQTDQQKLTIQHSLAQLELLKKALMQKYFG